MAFTCPMNEVWTPSEVIGHSGRALYRYNSGDAFFRRGIEGRFDGARQRAQHGPQGARAALRLSWDEHGPRAWSRGDRDSVLGRAARGGGADRSARADGQTRGLA